jgi:hypothetical protein
MIFDQFMFKARPIFELPHSPININQPRNLRVYASRDKLGEPPEKLCEGA